MSEVVKLKVPAKSLDLADLRVGAPPAASPAQKLRPRATEPFVLVSVEQLKRGAEACGGQRLLVWLYILHKVKLRGEGTVQIANKTLAEWGVSRHAKVRALRELEAVGLISVEWRGRRTPIVTATPTL